MSTSDPQTIDVALDSEQVAPSVVDAAPKRDWSAALDLVQQACTALREKDDHIVYLESEAEQRQAEMVAEMEALQAQLRLARREIERAYGEAATASARAIAAETWLEKLGTAISSGFGNTTRGAFPRQEKTLER